MKSKQELIEQIKNKLEQAVQQEDELAQHLDFVFRNEKTAFEMLNIENPIDQISYYESLVVQRRGLNWVINNLRNQLIILNDGKTND